LIDKINESVVNIAKGRKALDTEGEAEAGRIAYHTGLADAMSVFQETALCSDTEAIILVEHAFLTEEKRFCDPSDNMAIGSLTAACDSFDDALRALRAVMDTSLYLGVELGFPRNGKYRVERMPKDAFHIACIAHKTRLSNTLKTPGLNMTEKSIYQQRINNMSVAEKLYLTLQKEVLDKVGEK
jgi:hypothetical protein